MCGICGIVNYNRSPVDKNILGRMNKLLYHRGPDDNGVFISPETGSGSNAGLAMRRLSIIDLKTGAQPIHNEDKSLWIVFNGEIYNYIELRKDLESKHKFITQSDTEVILHLFEEYGEGFLGYLRGMFAIAIWDDRKKRLLIARDRLGQKPLYYTWIGDNFYFSSEMKSFLAVPGFKKDININSVDTYLTYQFVASPETIWNNVFSLPAATSMIVDEEKRTTLNRYWNLDFRKKTCLSFEEAKKELFSLVKESTGLRMISDVPLGLSLSGGLDSSVIAALMSGMSNSRIKTFSIGFRQNDFSELKYARMIAERFKTEHHEFIVEPKYVEILDKIVWHYDQPYADCSALPSYYLAEITCAKVKVALNGDGGDENFCGYMKYKAMKLAEMFQFFFNIIPVRLLMPLLNRIKIHESSSTGRTRYLHRFFRAVKEDPALRNLIWRSRFTDSMKENIYTDEIMKSLKISSLENNINLFRKAPADNNIDRMLYADIMTVLPDDLLVKIDIASMANSLEARSPFLDHKLLEFTSSIPPEWKLKGLNDKFIMKETFKELLPKEIIAREKHGFSIPLGKWFREELKDFVSDVLLSQRSKERGFFKETSVRDIIKAHMEGKYDHGYCIWMLLMLEMWFKVYIDNDNSPDILRQV